MTIRHVLIIEDDCALREELVELITALGACATGAGTGHEARATWDDRSYDLVLCDYKLQMENGLDVLKSLSPPPPGAAVPVFYLMTGHLDLTSAARAEIAAATAGLLMKPIRAATLRALVRQTAAAAQPC